MRFLLAPLLLLAVAQVPEPPELPPGQFCEHVERGRQPAHPCACQRECQPNTEIGDDGKPHETITVHEDAQCKQYCHKDHCHCPVKGCD